MTEVDPRVERVYKAVAALDQISQEVGMLTDDLTGAPLVELAVNFHHLKTAYKAMDTARKKIGVHVDRVNKAVFPERLENEGLDKFQVPELGQSFYTLVKYSASIVPDARDDAFDWLRDNGAESLITETVNAGTLASHFRKLVLDEGIDPPEELFKFGSYNTTGSSKYTPKEKI